MPLLGLGVTATCVFTGLPAIGWDVLAACVKAWRRVGTARNRGLGKLVANLYDRYPEHEAILPVTDDYFESFRQEVQA